MVTASNVNIYDNPSFYIMFVGYIYQGGNSKYSRIFVVLVDAFSKGSSKHSLIMIYPQFRLFQTSDSTWRCQDRGIGVNARTTKSGLEG